MNPNNTGTIEINGKEYNTFTEPPVAMAQERAKTSFPVREMTYFLDGGEKNTLKNEQIMEEIERDPLFNNDNYYDLNKEQIRELTMERVAKLSLFVRDQPEDDIKKRFALIGIADMGTYTRLGVHYGLFFGAVRGTGTAEQFGHWISKGAGDLRKFYGCFSMTELGHGSNLAGLETTAIYDEETDEFIINTPHIAATKWWIGGAAHTATHTVVFARLIVKGKDYGVKTFVVQLRNINDHSLKVGISIGDIGKKMGRDGIDNGWIQFTNVRIPRQNLLMKYTKVDREGNVTQPPLAQLTYGSLITGRVSMASDSHQVGKRFITIALRYACIRRQFSTTPGQPETKIIDYPYHQRRLLPLLAYVYALKMTADEVGALFSRTMLKMDDLKPDDKAGLNEVVSDVKELFSVSAGLKAFSTWACADVIDKTRQACGGHGYSGYNGFGQAYADWVVQCTWEGDNNILTLSAGRALIQSAVALRKGEPVGNAVSYLKRYKDLANAKLNGRSLTDPKVLVEAWEVAAGNIINRATDQYEKLIGEGLNADQAFEVLSQQRFQAAKVHTRRHLIAAFFSRIDTEAGEAIKQPLLNLALLFALWSIEEDSGLFLREGFLEPKDIDTVTELVNKYCTTVREEVIGYTDAFNLSDYFINAPIGCYDGDAYRHYFQKVNEQNPARDPRPPYYASTLKPFLFREEEDDDICELDEE
ncbi:YALI0F10857p [Yarrowia lipolytica CLIB122]|jgi:acyl-CoA oxidase|uniref:Acyl-coenzyme A oxidase 2 n=3 Tax=Yarrowia lipolytica TaxID=4952 RepID=ACOX2_YARLI|eukprot:XP_505264.1 YALI0F10857p [Yarrowia lipolytica CLIB122]